MFTRTDLNRTISSPVERSLRGWRHWRQQAITKVSHHHFFAWPHEYLDEEA
jgi:hypothetical protein